MNTLNSVFKVIIAHEKPLNGIQAASVLKSLAERPGVDFFCNRDHQPEGNRSAISSVLPRAEANSFSRFDTIHCGASHRGWGIND